MFCSISARTGNTTAPSLCLPWLSQKAPTTRWGRSSTAALPTRTQARLSGLFSAVRRAEAPRQQEVNKYAAKNRYLERSKDRKLLLRASKILGPGSIYFWNYISQIQQGCILASSSTFHFSFHLHTPSYRRQLRKAAGSSTASSVYKDHALQ